jgi:hypothetical protein
MNEILFLRSGEGFSLFPSSSSPSSSSPSSSSPSPSPPPSSPSSSASSLSPPSNYLCSIRFWYYLIPTLNISTSISYECVLFHFYGECECESDEKLSECCGSTLTFDLSTSSPFSTLDGNRLRKIPLRKWFFCSLYVNNMNALAFIDETEITINLSVSSHTLIILRSLQNITISVQGCVCLLSSLTFFNANSLSLSPFLPHEIPYIDPNNHTQIYSHLNSLPPPTEPPNARVPSHLIYLEDRPLQTASQLLSLPLPTSLHSYPPPSIMYLHNGNILISLLIFLIKW